MRTGGPGEGAMVWIVVKGGRCLQLVVAVAWNGGVVCGSGYCLFLFPGLGIRDWGVVMVGICAIVC